MRLIGAFLMVCGVLSAQGRTPQSENAVRMAAGAPPIYHVTVTERTASAVNYKNRSGATKVDFRGTELLPTARGEAKVESKKGYIEIEVEFDNLQPANRQGSAYLTYVLWAITPEGRTSNLGEILLDGTKSKLDVTTELQVFGLVVTAEPYYAVTQPSDLVVMENVIRADTKGEIVAIDAKYELLQRGQYQRLANPLELSMNPRLPLELYEARNAVHIARSVGADRLAADTFQKAQISLAKAEADQTRKESKKTVTTSAREAVQMAEDSRAIAVKRQNEDELAAERQQSAAREAAADSERLAAQAQTAQLTIDKNAQAAASVVEADRVRRETEARNAAAADEANRLMLANNARAAAAAVEANRLRLANDAQAAASVAEADRVKRETDARTAAAAAEADRLKLDNEAQRAAGQVALDNAARQKLQLETEKAELRTQLLVQFNAILQTRDTARGLIVNMSDVLFDTGKFTLRPAAREKLAKVAGIVSGHPGLMLDVEGHTDSVGGDEYNQELSEQRGVAVREYLMAQGMAVSSVTTKGFGKTMPVATNDTEAGRQQNRRVELVISGEIIGKTIGTPIAAR